MPTAQAKILTIKVNVKGASQAKYRGARAAWLEILTKYNGKPLVDFVQHVQKNPPSTPKTGKYANVCEPPLGWVRFFIRQQLVEIVNK